MRGYGKRPCACGDKEGTARIAGKEPEVLHRTLPWLVVATVLMGGLAMLIDAFG